VTAVLGCVALIDHARITTWLGIQAGSGVWITVHRFIFGNEHPGLTPREPFHSTREISLLADTCRGHETTNWA
jgi:hypothetical protein